MSEQKWNGKAFNLRIPMVFKDGYVSTSGSPIKHDRDLSIFHLQFFVLRVAIVPDIEIRAPVLWYSNFENGPSYSLPL